MWWPFRRAQPRQPKTAEYHDAAHTAVADAGRPPAWEHVHTLQRTIADDPPTSRLPDFRGHLTAHRDHRLSGSLGHYLAPDAPSGQVDGVAHPSTGWTRDEPSFRPPRLAAVPGTPTGATVQRSPAAPQRHRRLQCLTSSRRRHTTFRLRMRRTRPSTPAGIGRPSRPRRHRRSGGPPPRAPTRALRRCNGPPPHPPCPRSLLRGQTPRGRSSRQTLTSTLQRTQYPAPGPPERGRHRFGRWRPMASPCPAGSSQMTGRRPERRNQLLGVCRGLRTTSRQSTTSPLRSTTSPIRSTTSPLRGTTSRRSRTRRKAIPAPPPPPPLPRHRRPWPVSLMTVHRHHQTTCVPCRPCDHCPQMAQRVAGLPPPHP